MDRHLIVTDLFLACRDLAAADRTAYLIEHCGDDRELIEQVEGMLAFEQRRPAFLARSAVEDALGDHGDRMPESIGPFRILRKLGEGGMGAVYEAEQERPHRIVALKVLRSLSLSPDALRRFEHEGEFLARLQHPGIAQIFDSGRAVTEHGMQPYFALELVRGEPLTGYARKHGLAVRERLELLARVADAVQHAHQHGVIHRDLKPANILVGESGQPKVLDFGIARASNSDVQFATQNTNVGQILGTLAYMSPEQASGDPDAIDTRSDVYSLGVILYELVADRLPYDVSKKSLPEAVRIVQEQAPQSLGTTAGTRGGDLETIVLTALEKDKERRYSSAAALAADLRHFLRREPIAARPPSRMYTLSKLVQRNKPLAGAMAALLIALVAGLVASLIFASRASTRADEVRRLSAFQQLEDLRNEADRLWPPSPRILPEYEAWMVRAHDLLAGLEPRPEEHDPGHRAQLAKLGDRALPYTAEDQAAERRSHPRVEELEHLRKKLSAFERAREVRAGEAEPESVALDLDALPENALELIELATPLVELQRTHFGEEARGLALVRLALERVEDDEAFAQANTLLAQALFAVGKPEEGIEQLAATVPLAPDGLRRQMEIMKQRLERWLEAETGPGGAAETPLLAEIVRQLELEVSARREWRFDSDDNRWWFNQLRKLIRELESFESEFVVAGGVSQDHGWSVGTRLTLARELEAGFAVGGPYARAWSKALPAIAAAYAGLDLTPQMGLVPISADSSSGRWEFWHPATGTLPERDETGRLILTEATGLVFVLIPAGTFMMGAQSSDRSRPNYDRLAGPEEGPVHEVTLPPYFLSKYELTQGQWRALTGEEPSYYIKGANMAGIVTSWLHPVETVSWSALRLGLGRLGLVLPSEAEWEYGARAGTDTPWSTGAGAGSLEGAANVVDAFAMANGGAAADWGPPFAPWDDGYMIHAPVGSFLPNAFGLHDVHGNVWEWCSDPYEDDRQHTSPGQRELDPLVPIVDGPLRPYRGGGYGHHAALARCTKHGIAPPVRNDPYCGCRPARHITGEIRYSGK